MGEQRCAYVLESRVKTWTAGEAAKWSLEGGAEPWFSDSGMHQSHLEGLLKQIAASHLQFQSQSVGEDAFPQSSWVILVQRQHAEKHWVRGRPRVRGLARSEGRHLERKGFIGSHCVHLFTYYHSLEMSSLF